MKVQINSDNHVVVDQSAIDLIVEKLESDLDRFSDSLTRIELHLSDENSTQRGGSDDIRCLIEARLAGMQPVTVESRNASESQAIRDASAALLRRLSNVVERQASITRRGERQVSQNSGTPEIQ